MFRNIYNFLTKEIWIVDLNSLRNSQVFFIKLFRLVYKTFYEYNQNELTLRAMGLVYITLLSLIPLIAFSLSLLKAFGVVDNQLEPFLDRVLEPLGGKGNEISQKILEFITNIRFGVLGTAGLVMLIYTSLNLIKRIDDSINHIWKVKRTRSLARRFSDYISLLLIGPIVIFAVVGLTASLESNDIVQRILSIEPFGTIVFISAKIFPYIIIISVFTFIYMAFPNINVRFKSALTGGIISGISFQTISWVFASFISKSTHYAAIYSSLAVLIVFMIWLYANWLILLIGAQFSYCYQNLNIASTGGSNLELSPKLKEKILLTIMYMISYSFYNGGNRYNFDKLSQELKLPNQEIYESLEKLEKNNFIVKTDDNPPTYVPSKDLENIKINELIKISRENEHTEEIEKIYLSNPVIDKITDKIEKSINEALEDNSFKDLLKK